MSTSRRQILTTMVLGALLSTVLPAEAPAQIGSVLEKLGQIVKAIKEGLGIISDLDELKKLLNKTPPICSVSAQDLIVLGVRCRKFAASLKLGDQGAIPALEAYLAYPGPKNWELVRDKLSFLLEDGASLLLIIRQCTKALDPEALPKPRADVEQLNKALEYIRPTIIAIESAEEGSDLRSPDFVNQVLALLYSMPESAERGVEGAQRALEERKKTPCP